MKPHGNFNVAKCVQYLRHMEIEVTDERAAEWAAAEADVRARRRANRRELKKSCGHFRSGSCDVYSAQGSYRVRHCLDCGAALETGPIPRPRPPHGPGDGEPIVVVA